MAKLDGKVAVITGTSSGIGKATAEALAAEVAAVVLATRREDKLKDLVERIQDNGGRALAVSCDVTDAAPGARPNKAKAKFERVDIVVNNASVMLLSRIQRNLSDEWRWMFNVKVSFT